MRTLSKITKLILLGLLVLSLVSVVQPAPARAAEDPGPPSGSGVYPYWVADNPTCAGLGLGEFSYKVDPPDSGTYLFDGLNSVTVSTDDGIYFDWSATISIDAVIVKGGPNANVYEYDPEASSDTYLHSPINPNTGIPYGLSHIDFCYDYEVEVEKDASTSFTRTWDWDITKDVTPATWNLFSGDSGTSQYTVAVDKTGYTDSDWAVNGSIWIYNPSPFVATITDVSDVVSPDITAAVDCGVSFPHSLASEGTLVCTYGTDLPDGSQRLNTATATTEWTQDNPVGGNTGTADVIFGEPTTQVNDEINVTDSNGLSWGPVSDDASWKYTKTFACDADAGQHDNTATIVETGDSDDASVMVNCYDLDVSKDASTAFTRTYNWTIDKTADQTALTLSIGQTFLVNYSVTVDATYTDSAWGASGNIWVYNPAPMAATINGVSDLVSPDIAATVDCGVEFPYSLAAGGTLQCTYSASLPDASGRTNTATATLQNYDYDYELNATADGTTDFSGSADVDLSNAAITHIDECIAVNDTYAGYLGDVCYGVDALPKTFTYSRWIGPYEECGYYFVDNTADFVTYDTGATGSDDWTVTVYVPCEGGCTLTPGYWKTHSEYGPAPYDDTWAMLPNGADTPFFLSGQSYYEVLWTSPSGGNAYYILAHQYIAAQLNVLNGASIPDDVSDAWDVATSLFETYTPDEVAALKGKTGKELRDQFIALAELLDDYNNGLVGPGHCSE